MNVLQAISDWVALNVAGIPIPFSEVVKGQKERKIKEGSCVEESSTPDKESKALDMRGYC